MSSTLNDRERLIEQFLFQEMCSKISFRDNFVEKWIEIPARSITFPNPATSVAILAVDAVPTQGGGALYFPNSDICRCYAIKFEDLGIFVNPRNSTQFEMVNLLIALCVFKQGLINRKAIRLLVDNEKIRQSKNDPIVQAIWSVLDLLEIQGVQIVNEVNDSHHYVMDGPDDKAFMKVADNLSRDKLLPKDQYSDTDFYNVSRQFISKFKYMFMYK